MNSADLNLKMEKENGLENKIIKNPLTPITIKGVEYKLLTPQYESLLQILKETGTAKEDLKKYYNDADGNAQYFGIEITNNSITGLQMYGYAQMTKTPCINKFPYLKKLNLACNQIEEITNLEHLGNLQELYIGCNCITEIKGLENLAQLVILDLSENPITEIKGLNNLCSLEELYLSGNKINEIKGLENLSKLKKLYLIATQIIAIKGLENLTNLQTLGLGLNKISNNYDNKEIIEKLRQNNVEVNL
jgi:Leucine-rich repeat (LRR) protein